MMGTKNEPGKYDCYSHAHPDEPMFVLLGRDPQAPALVRLWVEKRRAEGESLEKLAEAEKVATEMEAWQQKRKTTLMLEKHIAPLCR